MCYYAFFSVVYHFIGQLKVKVEAKVNKKDFCPLGFQGKTHL